MRPVMIPAQNNKRPWIVFSKMIRDSISKQDEIDLHPKNKGFILGFPMLWLR